MQNTIQPREQANIDIVYNTAYALVYKGLDANTAMALVATLNAKQHQLLIFTLVKMMQKFEGQK